jgi:hypothetical protein
MAVPPDNEAAEYREHLRGMRKLMRNVSAAGNERC